MRSSLASALCCLAVVACDVGELDAPDASIPSSPAPTEPPTVAGHDLAPTSPTLVATEDGPGRVRAFVRFAPGADRGPALAFLEAAHAYIGYRYRLLPDLVSVRALPAQAITELAAIPGVVAVIPDRIRHANLAQSRAVMHASPAEMTGFSDGAGVRVCVLDSGINQSHPAFAGAIAAQYDFVNHDPIAQDDHGHGTNVAGIVASRDPVYTGVAPGASLLVGKVLAANGGGFDADIVAAIEWCTLDVAGDVSNMSLGGGSYLGTCDSDVLAEAVNASVDAGVVHVVAAGNEGATNATGSPACASRAIAVAAVYDAPAGTQRWCLNSSCSRTCTDTGVVADKLVCFSNRSMKVSVAAPGSAITAPDAFSSGVSSESGTSQATPHVAGLIARLLGERPELRPNQVRQLLWDNAADLGAAGFDVGYGHGRVDALATLEDPTAFSCTSFLGCDDGDPCTVDTCAISAGAGAAAGTCAHRAACEDGDATTSDTCTAGVCSHAAISADDGRTCTGDTLDACLGPRYTTTNGSCHPTCAQAVLLGIGVTVSGSTVGATKSIASTCPGFSMPGANVVYRVYLRPEQAVTFELAVTSAWDPSLYLLTGTSASACDVNRCVAGMDKGASAQNETLVRVRVPVAGYYFLVVDTFSSGATGTFTLTTRADCDPEDAGLSCDDGNACTNNDTCVGTRCVAGPDVLCADSECDDGDPCNGAERCLDHACLPALAPDCDDHNVCTSDACGAAGCAHAPVENGLACPADADVCNGAETCQAGLCASGPALVCNDHNVCTSDACDAVIGCFAAPLANGTNCADADRCNGYETCQAGVCSAGTALVCDDHDDCTADTCEPAGGCVYPSLADGVACSDGDACTSNDSCSAGRCVATDDVCNSERLVFAVEVGQTLGGVAVADEDLVRYDPVTQKYALYFDGSDVGLVNTGLANVAFLGNGELVMSFTSGVNLPGLVGGPAGTAVEIRDLVRFTPTTLGQTTSGTFTFYFDGSDVGLTLSAEALDALAILPDGSLVVSTTGSLSVIGVIALAQDLVRFTPTRLGAQTAGTWSMYLDGSDVGLADSSENLDAVDVLADGSLLLSTSGDFAVPGASGHDEDALRFVPTSLGATTAGSFTLYFDGSLGGFSGDTTALERRTLPL